MSIALPLLRLAVITLLLCFLFAQVQKRRSLFWPTKYPQGDWNVRHAVQPEDVYFTTTDGVRLHGWLFRSASPRAAMIWFHGNGGNITNRADIAAAFAQRGITTFVFDYRGYGRSEGTPTERGLYRDSEAAYDALAQKVGATPIVVYGESLGGPYAADVATKRRVSCVIIENSFPSLAALGNALYAPLPLGWFVAGSLTTVRSLNRAGRPVLVMHGRRDSVIPFRLGQQLFEQLNVEKELFVSETADHSEIAFRERGRYFEAVGAFVRVHAQAGN